MVIWTPFFIYGKGESSVDSFEYKSRQLPIGVMIAANSNLHSKCHRGGKNEAPEAYNQYVEDTEDADNKGETMNTNWNKVFGNDRRMPLTNKYRR